MKRLILSALLAPLFARAIEASPGGDPAPQTATQLQEGGAASPGESLGATNTGESSGSSMDGLNGAQETPSGTAAGSATLSGVSVAEAGNGGAQTSLPTPAPGSLSSTTCSAGTASAATTENPTFTANSPGTAEISTVTTDSSKIDGEAGNAIAPSDTAIATSTSSAEEPGTAGTGSEVPNADALAAAAGVASDTTLSATNATADEGIKDTAAASLDAGGKPDHPALTHVRTLRQKLASGEAMVMGDLLKIVDWIEAAL